MFYDDMDERDKRALNAIHRLDSLGYILEHIDVEQMQRDKPLDVQGLLDSVSCVGGIVCDEASILLDYLNELEPSRAGHGEQAA